ncbi:AcrB/AcrD/AcrF family protein [Sphingomicrobium sediminis]|uniref:AcrB/AcrD/AcrF family protein n=1 Tax=Sphingomicrobium sediminis TaxID=2950949 RepID=A0A9X2EM45_9SPHN|nr:AcrB/AcrD/AcrF family protein [Sphingomicrobium sediminis]MCM8557944.1 AcrB/AcrD/AcrF family protein [Sphingomicrobium sediminis]
MLARLKAFLERRWLMGTLFLWLAFSTLVTTMNVVAIATLNLRDTDDNLRLLQVRDWLGGQGWYDLRQYRMLAPEGADIHWSRLVDLPIAGLILISEPFLGAEAAELFALAMAPLMALLVAAVAIALVARRVAGKLAWLPAMLILVFSPIAIGNFFPMRIDHHGWQLACLAWVMAGAVDPNKRRGGIIAGIATAASLTIGLELLIPLALIGAGLVLSWVWKAEEARRIGSYGVALALGCGLGFLLFASEANRALRCDALTPVWLSDMMLAGAAALLLAWKSPPTWKGRLILAGIAGVVLAAFHGVAFPQCLSRLEGVDPAVSELWLERVSEARGAHEHSLRTAWSALTPLVVGMIGYILAWRLLPAGEGHRRHLLVLGVPMLAAIGLVFWQIRAGGPAQLMAVPGAAAFVMLLLPRTLASGSALVRIIGTYLVAVIGLGALGTIASNYLPKNEAEVKREAKEKVVNNDEEPASNCQQSWVMGQLDRIEPATIFTHIDLAPRLLVTTHHTTITGPYHRNDEAIGMVLSVLLSQPDEDADAERTVRGLGSDYVMICDERGPGDELPDADRLDARLVRGEVPDWLEPVDERWLEGSPIKLFRVK